MQKIPQQTCQAFLPPLLSAKPFFLRNLALRTFYFGVRFEPTIFANKRWGVFFRN